MESIMKKFVFAAVAALSLGIGRRFRGGRG